MGIVESRRHRHIVPSDTGDDETRLSASLASLNKMLTASHPSNRNAVVGVWLDANFDPADEVYRNEVIGFQRHSMKIHSFKNLNNCIEFLNMIENEQILMYVSNDFIHELLSRIKSMPQVHSISIISQNGEKKVLCPLQHDKLSDTLTKVERTGGFAKCNTSRPHEQDLLDISTIVSGQYTKQYLKQNDQLFIYWMMVKTIIKGANYDKKTHRIHLKKFAEIARHQYLNNTEELNIIDEFEQKYHQQKPIVWYTTTSFIRSILSQAFRTKNIEVIIRMTFFLRDLYEQLQLLQPDTVKAEKLPIIVYRSHHITNEVFEEIRNGKEKLLSFNNFVISDPDYNTALNLAREAQYINKNHTIGIVFCIKVKSKQTSTPFAFVPNSTDYPTKAKSILFSIHSIFRISDMREIENRLWEIDLTLATDKDEQVICLTDLLERNTRESNGWMKLGKLMAVTRDFDQAKDIYKKILELTPESDVLTRARVYIELGNIADELGDYASALLSYQKANELQQEQESHKDDSLNPSQNGIGEVQRKLGDYSNALSTHEKNLSVKRKNLPYGDLALATTYNNLALTYESLGDYPNALQCQQKALDVKKRNLMCDHQDIGTSYNNIGELQRSMGNFSLALENFEKALRIRLKEHSPTDASVAILFNNIGRIHWELGHYSAALSYLQKALDIKLDTYALNHPSLTYTYNNTGDLYRKMGEYSKALACYQKALEIHEKAFSGNHPEIATTYTNIGDTYQCMGNYSMALSFYQKAIEIRQERLPPNHPSLAICYNNMGHVYQLMGKYTVALEYYQKALEIQQKSLREGHPSLAATYNNLADVQRKLENTTEALSLYEKAFDIKKKSLPPDHPTLVTTYNNIGVMHQLKHNYTAAFEHYRKALEIQQKTLPPNHPDLAAVYINMGITRQSMNEDDSAHQYYEKALEIQEKTLPSTHPNIAITHHSIAMAYVSRQDYKSALKHEQKAIRIASKTLDPDHPNLQTFQNYLKQIRMKKK